MIAASPLHRQRAKKRLQHIVGSGAIFLSACASAQLGIPDPASELQRQDSAMGWPFAIHDAPPISKVMPFDGALYAGHNFLHFQGHANRLSGMVLGLRCSDKVNDTYPMQWDVFVGNPLSSSISFATARHTGRFYLWAEF